MSRAMPQMRLSELLARAQHQRSDTAFRCEHAVNQIEEALRSIDLMNNDERESVMRLLTSWMLVDKFGPHARSAIHGFQRYSIAECLFEDPDWVPPAFGSDYEHSEALR